MSQASGSAVRFGLVTLFPEFFASPLATSMIGRAIQSGAVEIQTSAIRDFATNKARTVDDTPYGGGSGMILRATEVSAATQNARQAMPGLPIILMTPQGERFTQRHASTLASVGGAIFVCGRYEGVDERFVEQYVDVELSLGDFVLTGGEPAALVMIDAIARLRPGVLGNEHSAVDESFSSPRLEYPQFTRPAEFEGIGVPPLLAGGDHARVAQWRRRLSLLRTQSRRPDLLEGAALDRVEAKWLADGATSEEEWLVRPRTLAGWLARPSRSGDDV